jgi:YD repeat-containing protein
MRRTASTSRAQLICLIVCFSLLVQPLLSASAGASAGRNTGKATTLVGKSVTRRVSEAEAADLPDLNEARRRPHKEPKAIPPVESKRRRCPPHNRRCNDNVDGAPSATPTPMPTPTPRRAAQDNGAESLIAGFAGQSLLALMTAALNGGRPVVDVPLLDYYTGGEYSVSDSVPTLPIPATPRYAAVPALPVQAPDTTQPFVTGMSLGAMRADSPGWTGMKITTGAQALTLTALGRLCSQSNSLLHELRLIRSSDNVTLASTSVAMSGCTEEQFKYADLSSAVTLSANTAYMVVSYEVGGDRFHDWTGTWLSTTSAATVNYGVYTTDGGQTWGLAGGMGNSYVPLDFKYQTDEQGTGTGLTAKYYDNLDFTAYKMTRSDATVNFDWGGGSPATSMGTDQFSVRWTGMISPRYSQTYTFYTTTDDGVRLWVDGQLIIDKWIDQAPTTWSGQIALQAGRQYDIRMEFYENFGGASAKLEWQSASQAREAVPQSRLYGCWKGIDQFVKDFFQAALARQPNSSELSDWSNRLAQAQGELQLVEEARTLGAALFNLSLSSAYTARNRSDGDFVADLYRGYLQRDPDQAGWDYWKGQVAAAGRGNVREAFAQSVEFSEKVRRLCGTSAAADANAGTGYNFSSARLDPDNRTGGGGGDPLSRNFNFSVHLLGLAGRAGLDLGLTLSYNSLVWTKDASGVTFDADNGFPSPGFRLGFPSIQPKFVNPQLQQAGQPTRYSYLLITPSGGRVELRQVGTSNVYESADSSYLQLTEGGGAPQTLLSTDGTRLSFSLMNGEYRCTEVKDRNGNYISVAYFADGRINQVIDTLGRAVTFNYDAYQNLISITQPWRRETETQPNPTQDETHTWATFGYGVPLNLQPSFSNLAVMGDQPGALIPVLRQLGLDDGSYYKFEYNGWGQVWKVTHYAADSINPQGQLDDSHALSSTWLNLPGAGISTGGAAAVAAAPQTDCPRFTEERVWIEHGVMNQNAEVATSYSAWSPAMASCDVTVPDGNGTVFRDVYATSGWQKGLTTESHVVSGGQDKKWTTLQWTQDDTNAGYKTNPRVTDTTINDAEGNHRRTSISYQTFTPPTGGSCALPQEMTEYAANTTTVLRTTHTEYNLSSHYTNRRIIGLPSFQYLYDGTLTSGTLMSKEEYVYDDSTLTSYLQALPSAASQHDGVNYGTALRWRGNASRVRRYDVTGGASTFVENQVGYNVTGTVAFVKDAAGHQTSLSYTDSFFQNVNRTNTDPQYQLKTFAYPTTITDPDSFTSTSAYNYDMGTVRQMQTPLPNVTTNQPGPVGRRYYDSAGRVVKALTVDTGAYTRVVYPAKMDVVQSYALIEAGKEAYFARALDGAGRVRATARYLPPPNDPGTGQYAESYSYSGQYFDYDSMGRLVRQSNPTEMNSSWTQVGADASGWVYSQQTFDWKGRPLVATNADGTTYEYRYGGCGCAGGEVVTTRDEVGRRQRGTYDVLGRLWKTQVLFAQDKSQPFTDDPNEAVYSTKTNTYNVRDQLTEIKEQAGTSGTAQLTTMNYDGHGRLQSSHQPEQDANAFTTFTYNPDDTRETATDARGAKAIYGYNDNRKLLTSVSYDLSAVQMGQNVAATATATFAYDAAGNRTQMTDGFGTVGYQYDVLSRLMSETRTFSDPVNTSINGVTKAVSYDYNLAGELKYVTDPTGYQITYTHGRAGQLTDVTGSPSYGSVSTYASGIQYRAWGGLKAMGYGNGRSLAVTYNSRMQVESYQIPGVISTQYRYTTTPTSSDNDGRVKFAQDMMQTNSPFDRAYRYDHVGRLTEALTGSEARGGATANVPYYESYGYDVWGNLTARGGRNWSQVINGYSSTFVNNRNPAAIYDADGRPKVVADLTTTYDAEGRSVQVQSGVPRPHFQSGLIVAQGYDGNGVTVKHKENSLSTYYVRSSVLGQVVAELDGAGAWKRGYVYDSGGGLLATRDTGALNNTQRVEWIHSDPITGNQRRTDSAGTYTGGVEVDPMGADAGFEDRAVAGDTGGDYSGGEGGLLTPPRYADILNGSAGCTVDGAMASCDLAKDIHASGAGTILPPGVSTIMVKVDYDTGDLHVRGTNLVIGEDGRVYKTTGVKSRACDEDGRHCGPWSQPTVDAFTESANFFSSPQKSSTISKRRLEGAINNCLQELSPALSLGSFVPTQKGKSGKIIVIVGDWKFEDTSTITVHNDVTHGSVGLGNLIDQHKGQPFGKTNREQGSVVGYTRPGDTDGYTASDADRIGAGEDPAFAALVGPYIETQLHELARGLGNKLYGNGNYFNTNKVQGSAGKDFTDCVRRGLEGK